MHAHSRPVEAEPPFALSPLSCELQTIPGPPDDEDDDEDEDRKGGDDGNIEPDDDEGYDDDEDDDEDDEAPWQVRTRNALAMLAGAAGQAVLQSDPCGDLRFTVGCPPHAAIPRQPDHRFLIFRFILQAARV